MPTSTHIAVVIFGGTAAYYIHPGRFAPVVGRMEQMTPYGVAAPFFLLETPAGIVGFTSRHGEGALRRSARFINHRANVWAAHALGARYILSWNGVGSLRPEWAVGDLVVMSDIVDFTRGREDSFAKEGIRQAMWPQARTPFAPEAREVILHVVSAHGYTVRTPATYACSEGPRLETVAEIRLMQLAGADVVGMTLCPEVWLAHELGIGYASLGFVTNHATGVEPVAASGRQFGPIVAETCFPILLETARRLMEEGEGGK